MRLICPNCAASYEIEASLVPAGGRDVQCSACGHAWFQEPERGPDDETAAEPSAPPVAAQPQQQRRPGSDGEAPAAPAAPARPRTIDPAVLDILRSEAEFEARARRNEAAAIESQGDLGLSEAQPRRPPARAETTIVAPQAEGPSLRRSPDTVEDRDPRATYRPVGPSPSFLPEDDDPAPDAVQPERRSFRSRFPDPDSFDPSDRGPDGQALIVEGNLEEVPEARRMGGFRWGFLVAVGLLVLTTLLYLGADNLRGLLPAADPMIDGFVAMVDSWRGAVNGLVRQITAALTSSASAD